MYNRRDVSFLTSRSYLWKRSSPRGLQLGFNTLCCYHHRESDSQMRSVPDVSALYTRKRAVIPEGLLTGRVSLQSRLRTLKPKLFKYALLIRYFPAEKQHLVIKKKMFHEDQNGAIKRRKEKWHENTKEEKNTQLGFLDRCHVAAVRFRAVKCPLCEDGLGAIT